MNETAANPRPDNSGYCYIGGKLMELTPAPGKIAVKFSAGRQDLSAEAAALLKDRATFAEFVPNYGVKIYETDVRDRALALLSREASVEFANPVFQRGSDPNDILFVDDRFAVQFKPGVSTQQIEEFNARYGVTIAERLGYAENLFILKAPQGQSAIALANVYHDSGLILSSEPNLIRQPRYKALAPSEAAERIATQLRYRIAPEMVSAARLVSRDNYLAEQWHLDTAQVIRAWNISQGSASIRVAILDDGVDLGHPEFNGKVSNQFDFESNTPDGNPKTASDKHGTSCAGVAVAAGVQAYGAAPRCSLIAARTPNFLGVADEGRMFQWAADQQADVISCSWGPADGTGSNDPLPSATALAIEYCIRQGRNGKGIPIFWAAGNGNESVMLDGYASNPNVIAVAASTDHETKAYYSDSGPAVALCAPSSGSHAQGEKAIFTTDRRGSLGYNAGSTSSGDAAGDYTNGFGGTSSATPLVAGIAGLMLSIDPNLTWQQVRDILKETADKIGSGYDSQGHSDIFGNGRVNALAALQRVQARSGGNSSPSGQASIQGPAGVARNGSAPSFQVNPAPNQFYVVEFATQSNLFDTAGQPQRNTSNFYATWQDTPFLTSSSYTMPQAKWDALKNASQLFYRIWTSSSNTGWTNAQSTNPASLQITGGSSNSGSGSPSIQGPAGVARDGSAPSFQVNPAPNQFYVVEFATQSNLFDTAGQPQRNTSNFYATWQDTPFLTSLSYTMPQAKWDALKNASQLFYRIWTSSSNTGWINAQSTSPASLQITGSSSGSGSGGPSIQGPASAARDGSAPNFQVNPAPNQFYVVEFATQSNLFDTAGQPQRNTSNFYATWQDTPFLTSSSYTMPQAKWDALKNASQLFYRIWTSSSNTGWTNAQSTNPASLQITQGDTRMGRDILNPDVPGILGPDRFNPTEPMGPSFHIQPGRNRFFAVEVATDPRLFDPRQTILMRTPSNFYASWQVSLKQATSPTVYTLPAEAWANLLKPEGTRLYFRALTTSTDNGQWLGYMASTSNEDFAKMPSVLLAGRQVHLGESLRDRDAALWMQ